MSLKPRSRRMSLVGMGLLLVLVSIISTSLAFSESLNKNDFASYKGLSEGEAWDLRYGHGEVAGDYMGTWTIANCEEATSLYETPDEEAEVLITIQKWEDVDAYYYDSEWFECVYGEYRGYILREFLTDRPGKYVDYPGNSF